MDAINIEIKLDQKLDIEVDLGEVIEGINNCVMKKRWNYIALILNEVSLNVSDLTDDQKELIKNYLTNKLSLFQLDSKS